MIPVSATAERSRLEAGPVEMIAPSAKVKARPDERRARRTRMRLRASALALLFGVLVVTPASSAAPPAVRDSSMAVAQSKALTISVPATVVPGDVMIAALSGRTTTGNIEAPQGWKLLRRDMSGDATAELTQALYYRVAGGHEPSSFTWSLPSSVSAVGALVAYGGVKQRRPIVAHAGAYTGDGSSVRAPSIRTSARRTRILAFYGSTEANGITPPSGLTERFDVAYRDVQLEGASYVQRPVGATGVKWARDSAGASAASSFGQLVALRTGCSTTTGRPRAGQHPAIIGQAYVGQKVVAYTGSWCGTRPVRLAYRWLRCKSRRCGAIRGAAGSAYTPTRKDLGASLTLRVKATNSADTTTATSSPKRVGTTRARATSPPQISGTAVETFELSASTGTWTGLQPIDYAYGWRRCDAAGKACASLPDATAASYPLTAADVGSTLRVVVTATNSVGSNSATSRASDVVRPAPSAPTPPSATTPPAISGNPTEGASLTASAGSWSGTTPLTYEYQWQRCDSGGTSCSDLIGATASDYALVSTDVGSRLRILVTASNTAGLASLASSPTAVVAEAPTPPMNTAPPASSGTAEVGAPLSASAGSWIGTAPIAFSYQWRRCDQAGAGCTLIAGATGASYTAGAADAGSTLRVVVTAVNAYGSNFATSGQTSVVQAAPAGSVSYPASFYTGPAGDNNILPTKPGVFLGIAPGGQGMTFEQGEQQAASREAYVGRKLDIDHHFVGGCTFDATKANAIISAGRIPMFSWQIGYSLDRVNAGSADACFSQYGQGLAAWGRPIFLRIYWEFNLPGAFPYSGTGQPFIDAWRRTVNIIKAQGVTKASFVWAPGEGHYSQGMPYSYPGDSYVDWVASDGYNFNAAGAYCGAMNHPHDGWCQFEEIFHDGLNPGDSVEIDYRGHKPFMTAETASVEGSAEQKGSWFVSAGTRIKAVFPGLYAYVYFDQDYTDGAWRIATSTSSLDGFKTMAQDAYFNTRS
jgi:hypothetical protein